MRFGLVYTTERYTLHLIFTLETTSSASDNKLKTIYRALRKKSLVLLSTNDLFIAASSVLLLIRKAPGIGTKLNVNKNLEKPNVQTLNKR